MYVNTTVDGTATLDLSTSASPFVVNVGSVLVGNGATNARGVLRLGANNSITASTQVGVGTGGAGNVGTLTTANGSSTTINTPIMKIGWTKESSGTFTLGTGASLTLAGVSGESAQLIIGNHDNDSMTSNGRTSTGLMNLTGGTASLTLSQLVVGEQTQVGSSNQAGNGQLLISANAANHLAISGAGNVVLIGYSGSAAQTSNGTTGTLTIGNLDATSAITVTDNSTAILLGYKNPSASSVPTGTLNLNGGTLTITTTGSAIAGGGGTANLVLGNTTGNGSGMILKAGTNSTAWITGLSSAKIKATGVTFDSNGYDITIPQPLLVDASSTGGGLIKDGAGTVTLSGTNTYTGATTVSNGTLLVTGSITSAVTVASSGAIGGTGTISNNVTLLSGGQAVFTPGFPMKIIGTLQMNGGNVVRVNLTEPLVIGQLYPLATYTEAGSSGSFVKSAVIESGSGEGVPVIVMGNGTVYLKMILQGTLLSIE